MTNKPLDSRTATAKDLPDDHPYKKEMTSQVPVAAHSLPKDSFIRAVCETFPGKVCAEGVLFCIEQAYDVSAGKATEAYKGLPAIDVVLRKMATDLNMIASAMYERQLFPNPLLCDVKSVPIFEKDGKTVRSVKIKTVWRPFTINIG